MNLSMGVKEKIEYKVPKNQSYLEQLLQLKYAAVGLYNRKAPSESWIHLLATKKALSVNMAYLYSNKRKLTHLLEETSTATSGLSAKKESKSSEALEGNIFLESSSSELINFDDPDEISKQKQETFNSVSSLEINNDASSNLTLQDDSECESITSHHHTSTLEHIFGVDVEEQLRRSNRLTKFLGDRLREKVIPIGKRFQADIPQCTGPPSTDYMLESSKWLGNKIWPNEGGNMCAKYMKPVGQGRPSYKCSCDYPNSAECINYHLHDERCRLIAEIDDAFFSWGFDQMGELASDSWTPEEQKTFSSLFKRKRTLSKENFWKRAFKCLPSRSRESIVSYYFNVFVLRNIRTQVRLGYLVVDSDDDDVDENITSDIEHNSHDYLGNLDEKKSKN